MVVLATWHDREGDRMVWKETKRDKVIWLLTGQNSKGKREKEKGKWKVESGRNNIM